MRRLASSCVDDAAIRVATLQIYNGMGSSIRMHGVQTKQLQKLTSVCKQYRPVSPIGIEMRGMLGKQSDAQRAIKRGARAGTPKAASHLAAMVEYWLTRVQPDVIVHTPTSTGTGIM